MQSKYVLLISIILNSLGAYRYVRIILWSHVRPGTCFKRTRFHVELGPRFGTDLYFAEIYKRRILISQCSVFLFLFLERNLHVWVVASVSVLTNIKPNLTFFPCERNIVVTFVPLVSNFKSTIIFVS